ncbi:YadA-like family protein [Candidatus Spongiihabitans sp.]|uniref:YadA-like family protein n=1 Tax=Candidatus Spongiihabitans sp. TaxID=3101308 RepID=UPI003C7E4331
MESRIQKSRHRGRGRKASVTGAGGIAIGAEVEAGENAIVIGTDAHSVEIGGVDINAVHTTLTDADTALGVRIGANTAGIARNADDIGANTAGIARNADDIETNRSGIAMSVALAHLPTIKGGGWGIAAGTFDSETAIAVGAHFEVQQNAFIKIGGASSGGETSFGVGFGKGW